MIDKVVAPTALDPGSIRRPDAAETMPDESRERIDSALADLQANKDKWVRLDIRERIAILDRIMEDLPTVAERWVAMGIEAKGIERGAYGEGEEWASFAFGLRNIRLLRKSLRDIQERGRPAIPGPVTTRDDGQVVARVFPASVFDRLAVPNTTAEVWMQPGVTEEEMYRTQARLYRDGMAKGKVALILGAGNSSLLLPTDLLYKLFVEGQVVILKLHPVNAYLRPALEEGFRALIEGGYLRIVEGGAEVGRYLAYHPSVDEIHMTGSDKTYDAIVFGVGAEGERRKAERRPLVEKRFTAELGNVSPVIVVPGRWSRADIEAQGERLARWLAINSGFNCLTPRVIVQPARWEHREALNDAICSVLKKVNTRRAYYPGAEQRMANFVSAHPDARRYGAAHDGHLQWTFITGVNSSDAGDICFRNEAFCGAFAETAIDAPGTVAYLEQAVRFANQTLWGNLTATIVAHPASLRDKRVGAAIDRAVADLRYGTVLINQFAAFGIFLMTATWGAYPGNEMHDIQSGIGVTTNVLMFDSPQKSVVRGPFIMRPDPFNITSRAVVGYGKKMVEFQREPSLSKVPGYLWSALGK